MTTATRNEAVERLRAWLKETIALRLVAADDISLVDEALAAERRATVERIRVGIASQYANLDADGDDASYYVRDVERILDEEAAR